MSDYDNKNKGALFNNKYKESGDSKPDYIGNFTDESDKEWRLAAWKSTSKNGQDYLSLRISEPQENGGSNNDSNESDDVPF